MRLARIRLSGFKSFADKTEVRFDDPLVGIVGPNGCGKSNVVDAVKWVLGELSPKTLRGSGMMDMIFNGSSTRRPAGMATVTLEFDNSDRTLAMEQDHVEVTRQLYRDGTSEYLINQKRARLKDIRELFLDTGVGTDAYSIIEQGRVDVLLQSSPQQRREIFEEAAGISRFKVRKQEAQRKLEKTEQNLTVTRQRLEDLESRLRSVKTQATKARNYREYDARLRSLRLTYNLAEYHQLQDALADAAGRWQTREAERAAAAAIRAERERALAEARESREQIGSRQNDLERKRLEQQSQRDKATQRAEHARSSHASLEQQIERDAERESGLGERIESLEREQAEQAAECERLESATETVRSRVEEAEQEQRRLQRERDERQKELEEAKSAHVDLLRRATEHRNQSKSLASRIESLDSSREKLEKRAREIEEELERLRAERAEHAEAAEEARKRLEDREQRLETERAESQRLGREEAEAAKRVAEAKETRSGLASRRAVLEEMQNRHEGVGEAVKAVLADENGSFGSLCGLLADLIETDVEHAPVVEAALGASQQAVVAERQADLLAAARDERLAGLNGRVAFLALDAPANGAAREPLADAIERAGIAGRVTPMRRLVSHPDWLEPVVERLLGHTLLVPDLESAELLRAALPGGYSFVTADGTAVDESGRMRAGAGGEADGDGETGLIRRRSELNALDEQIAEQEKVIADEEARRAELASGRAERERALERLQQEAESARQARVERESKVESLDGQTAKLEKEEPVVAAELEQNRSERAEAEEKRAREETKAEEIEQQAAEHQQRIDALESEIREKAQAVEAQQETVSAARVEASQVNEQLESARRQKRQADESLASARRERDEVSRQLAEHRERIASLASEIESADEAARQAEQQLEELAASQESMRKEIVEADTALRRLESETEQQRETERSAEGELQQIQMEKRELEIKIENLEQRAREQLGLEVGDAYRETLAGRGPMAERPDAPDETAAGESSPEGENEGEAASEAESAGEGESEDGEADSPAERLLRVDWDAIGEEIDTLRKKLDRLGNVNLDAIQEQETLEQQHGELAGQVRDIETARDDLERLIKQLNDDSRSRFEETFEAIRENFGGQDGLFRKLFGGGRAQIELVPDENGEVDVLESGIEITAKPPGKEPASIRQLSGGEKSMTAVALLMSVFQAKPSPFCILDEVDAALDEANVQRFADVVKGFLDYSHFIVVTHHKRTMQMCDTLYGVTMPEQGVSKRVAVRFDEVGAGGQLSESAAARADREPPAAEPASEPEPAPSGASASDNGHDDPEPDAGSDRRRRLAAAFEETGG